MVIVRDVQLDGTLVWAPLSLRRTWEHVCAGLEQPSALPQPVLRLVGALAGDAGVEGHLHVLQGLQPNCVCNRSNAVVAQRSGVN